MVGKRGRMILNEGDDDLGSVVVVGALSCCNTRGVEGVPFGFVAFLGLVFRCGGFYRDMLILAI